MNLMQAVETGLKFKRRHWNAFVVNKGYMFTDNVGGMFQFTPEDIMAEDWMVESGGYVINNPPESLL